MNLTKLRAAVLTGRYQIPPEDVARAILRRAAERSGVDPERAKQFHFSPSALHAELSEDPLQAQPRPS
jgi:hypothetical protein